MDVTLSSAGIARVTAWVACLFSCFAASALAQGPGSLDLTFGTGGSVITPISGFADGAKAVVTQPDGKLVLAGGCLTGGSDGDFCLVRYHADGTLDAGFGAGGKVTTGISSGDDTANALALQPDGRLIAAGACLRSGVNFDFCLARYNSNGTLDSTFGAGGVVSTPVGDFATGAKALVIQPDGMIVAGGSCYDNPADLEFCLVRYDANGALDATYGGGAAIVEFDDMDDSITALTLLPDGKVVAAGTCGVFGDPFTVFCMARFDGTGELDASFGVVARVMTDISLESDRVFALVRQPDGKLVIAGGCDTGSTFDSCLARYDASGVLDASFGAGGKVVTDVGGIGDHDAINGLGLQPDGKLVAAGFCDEPAHITFCLIRYDAGGIPDSTFGTGGRVTADINIGFDDVANALALQPDGQLVAAGKCDGAASSDFCAARYNGEPGAIRNMIFQITSNPLLPDNLAGPLHQAVSILTDHNERNDVAACGALNALLNQVRASEKNARLTPAQAGALRESAERLRLSLACR